MSFELDTIGADELDAQARRSGVPFGPGMVPPTVLEGVPKAPFLGVARGLVAKPALLLGDAVTPLLRPGAQAVDKLLGSHLDDWLADQQRRNVDALEALRPDPNTTGFGGQVVHGFADVGSSLLHGGAPGAAVLEGYARRRELMEKGVDPATATGVGVVAGAATFAGVAAPLVFGKAAIGGGVATVAKNVGIGGALAASSGITERGLSHDILRRNGYPLQADLLQPFEATSVAADFALGGLFSGTAAAIGLRFTERGQHALDAALTVQSAHHAAVGTAPGAPVDPPSMAAHSRAFDTAAEQVLRNEPVNVGSTLDGATFVREPSPAMQEAHAALREAASAFQIPPGSARGVRNNNPGNIVATAEPWQGQTGSDGRFATFESPELGIRALARNLIAYQERHGIDTIDGMVKRWAPPSENDTGAYVRSVAGELGVHPGDKINLRDPDTLQRLAAAIIKHENGAQPYPPDVLRAGVDMALGREPTRVAAAREARPAEPRQEPRPEPRPLDDGERQAFDMLDRGEPRPEPRFEDRIGADHLATLARDMEPGERAAAGRLSEVLAVLRDDPASVTTPVRAAQGSDPVVRAAAEAASRAPDMRVALEDGTIVTAREVFERHEAERATVERDATAYEAAVSCFLRGAA